MKLKNKIKKREAISLAELLIAIGIVGILAVLTVPSVVKTLPNENELRYRQVYGRMLSAVSSLAFDNLEKFPTYIQCKINSIDTNSACYGKNKADKVPSGFKLLNENGYSSGTNTTGVVFCNEIARMFNTKGVVNCSYNSNMMTENFRTMNGIIFYGLQQGFDNAQKQITICIDTNGDEGPNVGCTSNYNNSEKDQFRLQIGFRGDVAVGYRNPDSANGFDGMYDADGNLTNEFYCISDKDDEDKCGSKSIIETACTNINNGTTSGELNYCVERQFLQSNYSPTKNIGNLNQRDCEQKIKGVFFPDLKACVVGSAIGEPIDTCDGTNTYDKTYTTACHATGCTQNRYAAANKVCTDKGMSIPTLNEFVQLSKEGDKIYDKVSDNAELMTVLGYGVWGPVADNCRSYLCNYRNKSCSEISERHGLYGYAICIKKY